MHIRLCSGSCLTPSFSTGIGFVTAEQLAIHGAKVYLACRSESKALDAIRAIETNTPSLRNSGRVVWLPLDLSSVESSKKAAGNFLSQEQRLDILSELLRLLAVGSTCVTS